MNRNLIYEIALTLVKGIGPVISKQLLESLNDISLLFTEKKQVLQRIPGLSRKVINEIQNPDILIRAEKELEFIEQTKCRTLFFTSPDYPSRLKDCPDAPVMLYFLGNTDLNAKRIISVVGTRNASAYGREMVGKLLSGVKESFPETLIVSGLAYGIDIAAHKAALKDGLDTVGILAHGIDRIYPCEHRKIAIEMLKAGGLLTEYMSGTNPDRPNFVKRNRIVAGMSDCTIIVESAEKGGAIITGRIASSYHRDLFVFPGKVTDKYSQGCNLLLKNREASLITSAQDLFREMNWENDSGKKAGKAIQQTIFHQLSSEEKTVVDALSAGSLQLNQLSIKLNVPVSNLSVILFELEMSGVIICKPGGLYALR